MRHHWYPAPTLRMALRVGAPHALEDLRASADDPIAIAAWAKTHHLDSPIVIEYASFVRRDWAPNPKRAARLQPALPPPELSGRSGGGAVAEQPETPGQLLRRYRRNELVQHCLWFVELQVNVQPSPR
jgi:hypothetical protein